VPREHAFVADARSRDFGIECAWLEGVPLDEICRRFDLSKSRVSTIAKNRGLPQRQPRPTTSDRDQFVALYRKGLTITAIAACTGWHRDTVARTLRGAEIQIRSAAELARRWPVHHDAFAPPVSAEAWYWIGLLAADGYVRGASITLGLKNSSEPVLHRFLAFVGSPSRPLIPNSHNPAQIARASSPHLVEDLARHGVVPNKSYTMRTSAEAAREPMFWLGVFDGDGCITFSKRGVPTIGIVGSRALMTQYAEFLARRLYGRRLAVVKHAGNQNVLWQVRATGDRARQLAELWLACSEVSLEAKRSRLQHAAKYESRATWARLAVRRKRCGFCGAWVERMPSQLGDRVFCTRSHYWAWRRSPSMRRSHESGRPSFGQLQLLDQGL
jgi:hypothetical protein